jgi:2-iminobutanoate/2-iminopropanoate deaminase
MKHMLIFTGVLCCTLLFVGQAGTQTQQPAQDSAPRMKRQIIRIPEAPSSPLYSQAVKVGPHIYVTGVPGLDPQTSKVAGPTIQEQTRQALINCENILRAAGARLTDVVDVQVLLARPEDFAGLNEAYAKFFPTDPPVRSVARLGPDLGPILVSIRMTAIVTE